MRVERFGPSVSRFDSFEGPMGSFLCDAWHSRHNLGTKYFRQSLTQKKKGHKRGYPRHLWKFGQTCWAFKLAQSTEGVAISYTSPRGSTLVKLASRCSHCCQAAGTTRNMSEICVSQLPFDIQSSRATGIQ